MCWCWCSVSCLSCCVCVSSCLCRCLSSVLVFDVLVFGLCRCSCCGVCVRVLVGDVCVRFLV